MLSLSDSTRYKPTCFQCFEKSIRSPGSQARCHRISNNYLMLCPPTDTLFKTSLENRQRCRLPVGFFHIGWTLVSQPIEPMRILRSEKSNRSTRCHAQRQRIGSCEDSKKIKQKLKEGVGLPMMNLARSLSIGKK